MCVNFLMNYYLCINFGKILEKKIFNKKSYKNILNDFNLLGIVSSH